MSLNFAIFLHNVGDKSAALKNYKEFESRYRMMRAANPNAADQEVINPLSCSSENLVLDSFI
jgi:hypothetical protein